MQKIKMDMKISTKEIFYLFLKLHQYVLANKKTIFLFIVVGSVSAMVNLGSFCLLWKYAGVNYQVAMSVAYALSVAVHFTANRCIAFESRSTHYVRQMPRYFAMIFINYGITWLVTRFVVEVLSLTPYFGIVLSIGITINTSYILLRFWVFPKAVKMI